MELTQSCTNYTLAKSQQAALKEHNMKLDIIEEKVAELQTLEGNDYQTDYYPVSIEWLEQTLTTIHQQGVLSERERIAQWAKQNARTKDTMMSDFPENHEWTVDYHELSEELT